MKICSNGHLTGNKVCYCGAKATRQFSGDGRAIPKRLRPRDANGRNELDEIRRQTRVGGSHHTPRGAGIA